MTAKAYFSNIEEILIQELNQAQESISVASAWFNNMNLLNALKAKSEEYPPITIQILTSAKSPNDDNYSQEVLDMFDYFRKQEHTDVFQLPEECQTLMHHKFCLIDDKTVITGSFNWTFGANYNMENILVLSDAQEVANDYAKEFERISYDYIVRPQQEYTEYLRSEKLKFDDVFDGYINTLEREKRVPTLLSAGNKDQGILTQRDFLPVHIRGNSLLLSSPRIDTSTRAGKEQWRDGLSPKWKDVFIQKFGNIDSPPALNNVFKSKSLDCSKMGIDDLSGLLHMDHLEEVNCSENEIKSLEVLSSLPNLRTLDCSETLITSLDFSSDSIEAITCSGCNFGKSFVLPKFKNLTSLSISSNGLEMLDLSNAEKTLTYLDIGNNPLKGGLSQILKLVQLTSLSASSCNIDDLTEIYVLFNLTILRLQNNKLEYLDGIEKLQKLHTLDIWKNPLLTLKSLDPIRHNLKSLIAGKSIYLSTGMVEPPLLAHIKNVGFGDEKKWSTSIIGNYNSNTKKNDTIIYNLFI